MRDGEPEGARPKTGGARGDLAPQAPPRLEPLDDHLNPTLDGPRPRDNRKNLAHADSERLQQDLAQEFVIGAEVVQQRDQQSVAGLLAACVDQEPLETLECGTVSRAVQSSSS